MEFDRNQIRKTLFGNYKPAEVDELLDTAEELLNQRETEKAGEVKRLSLVLEEAGKLNGELQTVKESAKQLREENRRLAEENKRLAEESQKRREEILRLRKEQDGLRAELEEIRTELDLANSQTAILSTRVARQKRELDEKDKLLMEDPVSKANQRAEQIVQNAMNASKQTLDDAESMRSRALAAVRAAFFNTVSFRQNLEERFVNLQNDLDESIRTLRAIEAEDEDKIPDYVQEKWE